MSGDSRGDADEPIHEIPIEEIQEIPIEDTIDLHPFQPRDVRDVVEEYVYQAVRKGLREVRIIHGRGIGVQREIVRSVLEKHPAVESYSDMPDRGSTLATLRARD
jgi:dsDNA-specific endonuclease/ATPase MutS2